MLRIIPFFVLLLVALGGYAQTCPRSDYVTEVDEAQAPLSPDQVKRRADLRAMLRAQAERSGPIDPRRLTYAERAQMRRQLLEQRQEAFSQLP